MPLNPRALEIDLDACGAWDRHEVPANVYHALPGASPSQLVNWYGQTDAEAKVSITSLDPNSTRLFMGTVCHQACLEPEKKLPGVALYPETYTDDDGKEKPWTLRAKVCKAWRDMQLAAGNVPMFAKSSDRKEPGYEDILGMVESVKRHSIMRSTLQDEGTKTEVSCIWTWQNPDLMARSRVDIAQDGVPWLDDMKFTYDPSPENWPKHVVRMGYHIQAAMTLDLWNATHPEDQRNRWRWFAIQQKPPYLSLVHEASEAMIDEGRREYPKLLERFERCYRTDVWEGYPEIVYTTELPKKWS